VKYEDVYIRDYQTPAEARLGLNRYFWFYNHRRRHSSLDNNTPGRIRATASKFFVIQELASVGPITTV